MYRILLFCYNVPANWLTIGYDTFFFSFSFYFSLVLPSELERCPVLTIQWLYSDLLIRFSAYCIGGTSTAQEFVWVSFPPGRWCYHLISLALFCRLFSFSLLHRLICAYAFGLCHPSSLTGISCYILLAYSVVWVGIILGTL